MLVKPIITNISPTDARKVCQFSVHNGILGKLNLTTKETTGYGRLLLELKNQWSRLPFATEEISLAEGSDYVSGLQIFVNQEYRNTGKKNYRFGEILRLASIIEMLENQKNNFIITSKDSAIYFHSKYKFLPDIKRFDQRNKVLESISSDKSAGFKDLSEEATLMLLEIDKLGERTKHPAEQREFCKLANNLTQRYIERAQAAGKEGQKEHSIKSPLDMILTQKRITENKSFFNDLFQKHGIDYTI